MRVVGIGQRQTVARRQEGGAAVPADVAQESIVQAARGVLEACAILLGLGDDPEQARVVVALHPARAGEP